MGKQQTRKKSISKQRKAQNKMLRKWTVRIAIIMLALVFLAFMVISLFSAPKVV